MIHTIEHKTDSKFILGLDLGQVNDFTAIVVLERLQEIYTRLEPVGSIRDRRIVTGWREVDNYSEAIYHARHIERVKLGTSYPDIIERVKSLVKSPEIADRYLVAIDHTGVGRPVYDLFAKSGLETVGITITGGSAVRWGRGGAKVSKRLLVSTLQAVIQTGRLQFAKNMQGVDLLQREMINFRVKVTESANEIYAAREGEHDDLVLSLAMALWLGENYGNPQPKASQTIY